MGIHGRSTSGMRARGGSVAESAPIMGRKRGPRAAHRQSEWAPKWLQTHHRIPILTSLRVVVAAGARCQIVSTTRTFRAAVQTRGQEASRCICCLNRSTLGRQP